MESHGLPDMHPKPVTTPKRYGAGMAHTVASIGHVLSCCYCELLWITMDYRLSWTMMEYRGVSWIIVDYDGLIIPAGKRHINTLENEAHAKRVLRAFLREDMPVLLLGDATAMLQMVLSLIHI